MTTLVAHEPPIIPVLPDAEAAERARAGFRDAYQGKGWGAGMAAFIAMTSWEGEFTDDYFAQPAPDPAAFGMPAEDDGTRDDPLLSDRSWAVSDYRPDVDALKAAPTRIVIAVGEESTGTYTGGPRWRRPTCSASRRPCSRATTAASWAASSAMPASPRRSRASCARSSPTDGPDSNLGPTRHVLVDTDRGESLCGTRTAAGSRSPECSPEPLWWSY